MRRIADDLLGPWKPHPQNPVKKDAIGARMAGRIIVSDGKMYRFGMDCGKTYGHKVGLSRWQAHTHSFACSRMAPAAPLTPKSHRLRRTLTFRAPCPEHEVLACNHKVWGQTVLHLSQALTPCAMHHAPCTMQHALCTMHHAACSIHVMVQSLMPVVAALHAGACVRGDDP